MKNSILFNKIYGALIGSAIGDAMGGPVESLSYEAIEQEYGYLDTFLSYSPSQLFSHGSFSLKPGSYTDDTRMARTLTETMIQKRRLLLPEILPLRWENGIFIRKQKWKKGFGKNIT